jgi:heme iron utilization protein
VNNFLSSFKTTIIGTIDAKGRPFSSYAPYIYHENAFYIYISDIATHTKNIQTTPYASLFFIEDECNTQNFFARKRISLQCDANKIARNTQRFTEILEKFSIKFDKNLIENLKMMLDFNLYELHVNSGEATFGFGEAYIIGGEKMNELIPRRGGGHHTTK